MLVLSKIVEKVVIFVTENNLVSWLANSIDFTKTDLVKGDFMVNKVVQNDFYFVGYFTPKDLVDFLLSCALVCSVSEPNQDEEKGLVTLRSQSNDY